MGTRVMELRLQSRSEDGKAHNASCGISCKSHTGNGPNGSARIPQRVGEWMRRVFQIEGRIGPNGRIGARGEGPRAIRDVVVKQTVTSPHRHLAIAEDIIAKANAWSNSHRGILYDIRTLPAPNRHDPACYLLRKSATRTRCKQWERRSRIVIVPPVTELIVSHTQIQPET